jgi:hypothetical protein
MSNCRKQHCAPSPSYLGTTVVIVVVVMVVPQQAEEVAAEKNRAIVAARNADIRCASTAVHNYFSAVTATGVLAQQEFRSCQHNLVDSQQLPDYAASAAVICEKHASIS